jgi:CRISPR/Cas system CSM-associated protein Csm2 small subunit
MITQTSRAVYGANKAVTTTTPGKATFQKQTTSLNTKQKEITKRVEEAMAAAVALTDKHLDEVKLRQFFNPIHDFQDSHRGEDCMKIKSLP